MTAQHPSTEVEGGSTATTQDSVSELIHLSSGGVSLVLDTSQRRSPAVLHWGRSLASPIHELRVWAQLDEMPSANSTADTPTRLAILPSHHEGWMGRFGLSGHTNGSAWSPRFTVQSVSLNGEEVRQAGVEAPGGHVEYDLLDSNSGLRIRLEIEMTASGLVRTRATVLVPHETAGSSEPFSSYSLEELAMAFPVPLRASERLDFSGHWGYERAPQRAPISIGSHVRENRRGRTGHDSAYVLHAGVPGFGFESGEVWGVHVGFSGNHRHFLERLGNGVQVLGGSELLLPGEVTIRPGDDFATPWVYWTYGDGMDAAASRFHEFLRNREQHPWKPRPVVLNVWEAVYFDHSPEHLIFLAEKAAGIGVERFVLDDGWFRGRVNDKAGLGDWVVDEERWPDGLRPLIESVKRLGMEFGIWIEPEMVNLDSDLIRAHPDWLLQASAELPRSARTQYVLDLTRVEAYNHILAQLRALLRDNDIAYIKWDHNRDLLEAGSSINHAPAVHRQTVAVYRLMAELRREFPGVEIESCSAGGARIDLGVAEHTDRFWASDNHDALDRQLIQRWTGQLVPPELIGAHVARPQSTTTGRTHSLAFRAGTALFGHFGIEWDISEIDETERQGLARWLEIYKTWRPLLHSGQVVRADMDDDCQLLHGVVARDQSVGLYALVGMRQSASGVPGRIRFPGLAPDRLYRIDLVDSPDFVGHWRNVRWLRDLHGGTGSPTISGELLSTVGLPAPSLQPESLVLFEVTCSN